MKKGFDSELYLKVQTEKIEERVIEGDHDSFIVNRAISAIERCDIAVIVLDGTQEISEQDRRIAGYAREYKNNYCTSRSWV